MSEMIVIGVLALICVVIAFAALRVAQGYDSFADDSDAGWM